MGQHNPYDATPKSHMTRRDVLAATGISGSVLVAGCTGEDDDNGDSGEYGGHLNYALEADPDSLDPHVVGLPSGFIVVNQVYERLFEPSPEMEWEPVLAESMELTDDALSAIITLEEGVMFHPPFNHELTAEDVVASIDRVLDPDTGSPRTGFFDNFEDWYAEGDYEVRIDLSAPSATVDTSLAQIGGQILSAEAIDELGDDISDEPIGTGPFQFEERSVGDFIEISAFEDYWQDDLPRLDSITFRPISEPATLASELEAGDIEMVMSPPLNQAPAWEQNSDIEVPHTTSPTGRRRWHINASGLETDGRGDGAPTQDKQVRQAIMEATDIPEYVEIVENGYAEQGQTVFPSEHPHGIDYSPFSYEADQERAEELIAESDFEPPIELVINSTPEDSGFVEMTRLAEDQLGEVGFDVTIEENEMGVWVDRLNSFDFDLCPNAGGHSPDPALQEAERTFWTHDSVGDDEHPPYYDTPDSNWERVFEIFQEDDGTLTEEERFELYREQQELIAEDAVYAVMAHPEELRAHRTTVQNWTPHPREADGPKDEIWLE